MFLAVSFTGKNLRSSAVNTFLLIALGAAVYILILLLFFRKSIPYLKKENKEIFSENPSSQEEKD